MSCNSESTFEPLHNLYLGASDVVGKFTVNYLSSDRLRAGGVHRGRKLFVKLDLRVLRRCDVLSIKLLIHIFWVRAVIHLECLLLF